MRSCRAACHTCCEAPATIRCTRSIFPTANLTNDAAIIDIAAREGRTVVTKDYDFVRSYLVNNQPEKLLLVSTGNISSVPLEVEELQLVTRGFIGRRADR